jgi:hypothetical protein
VKLVRRLPREGHRNTLLVMPYPKTVHTGGVISPHQTQATAYRHRTVFDWLVAGPDRSAPLGSGVPARGDVEVDGTRALSPGLNLLKRVNHLTIRYASCWLIYLLQRADPHRVQRRGAKRKGARERCSGSQPMSSRDGRTRRGLSMTRPRRGVFVAQPLKKSVAQRGPLTRAGGYWVLDGLGNNEQLPYPGRRGIPSNTP